MTSLQTHIAQPKKNFTKIFSIDTPSYSDTILNYSTPIPFYVTKQGVLEIAEIDNVVVDLLTVNSFAGLNNAPNFQAKIMGGVELVTSLGQTTKDFLTAWIEDDEGSSPSGEFELVVKPVMTKVQLSTNPGQFNNEATNSLSDYAPSGTEYVTGTFADNYKSVWSFQSPMTVKYYSVALSKDRYATLNSVFDAN
jgi:hypothetical protein